jgi:hypothetical protein
MVPLGYNTNERRITGNASEADRVRIIFRSYLKLGSLRRREFVTLLGGRRAICISEKPQEVQQPDKEDS